MSTKNREWRRTAPVLSWPALLFAMLFALGGCGEDTTGPDDTLAPGQVTDLSVMTALWAGDILTVALTWTAPDDDGSQPVGKATAEYDLRVGLMTIDQDNWGSCFAVEGEPQPQAPGATEQVFLQVSGPGLTDGTTVYFALRSRDEAHNWSAISNVVSSADSDGGGPPRASPSCPPW